MEKYICVHCGQTAKQTPCEHCWTDVITEEQNAMADQEYLNNLSLVHG